MNQASTIKTGDTVYVVTFNGAVCTTTVTSVGRVYFYTGQGKFSLITFREAANPSNRYAYPKDVYAERIVRRDLLQKVRASMDTFSSGKLAALLDLDLNQLLLEESTRLDTYDKDPT